MQWHGDKPVKHILREAFSEVIPLDVLRTLGPDERHAINGAEILWIVKALEKWGPRLTGLNLICWGDNSSAIAGCISGYSPSVYVARLVGAVHSLLCKYNITCYFEWVHTASNPLDGASREQWEHTLLHELGATLVRVDPAIQLDLRSLHPDP